MTLFEFLKRINKERFPFTITYITDHDWIDVQVDAFFEKWVVTFADGDYLEHAVFADVEISDPEKPKNLDDLFDRPENS